MGILVAFVVLFCACYSPDIRDCTRACASSADCVASQVCNADHMCAAAAIASCAAVDARDIDSPVVVHHDAAIDAPPLIATLLIHNDGPGEVDTLLGNCTLADCTLHATPNVALTLTAVPHPTKVFDGWTSVACMNQSATCHFTPPAGTTQISAKFQ